MIDYKKILKQINKEELEEFISDRGYISDEMGREEMNILYDYSYKRR